MGDNLETLETKEKAKKSTMGKKILHYISTVIMYSLIFIMAIVFICFLVNFIDQNRNIKNGVTKPPIFSAYTIVSPSMVPAINVLDLVVTVRVNDPESLKIGDVITFTSTDYRYSGVTVTHRINKIEKTTDGKYLFTTKGDANNTTDASRIEFDDIYGKVILRIPKVGYLQYYLSSASGWIFIIVLPALAIISYDIVKLIKTLGKPKEKKDTNEKQKFKVKKKIGRYKE